MKTCLLVIDMQNEFKDGTLACDMVDDAFVQRVRELIEFCRGKNIEVIFTRHIIKSDLSDKEKYADEVDFCIEGTRGAEFIDGIGPTANEKVFRKNRISGLYKSELEEYLKEKGFEEVIICGVMTNCCVRQTALELQIRDFKILVVEDCCATTDKKTHNFTLSDIESIVDGLDVVSLDELKSLLKTN